MAKKPVLIQFPQELLDRLDRLSVELKQPRAAVVRDAVERYITKESTELKDRRMVEGYTTFPDSGEFDEWAEESAREMVDEEPW